MINSHTQPLLETYDRPQLVSSGLFTGLGGALSVDNVLEAYHAVFQRWSSCIKYGRLVIPRQVREMATKAINYLHDNDSYADLTPKELDLIEGRSIKQLRRIDGARLRPDFKRADEVDAENFNKPIISPTASIIQGIRDGAYFEALDSLTTYGRRTEAIPEAVNPEDGRDEDIRRLFEITFSKLAGDPVEKDDDEFYERERKRRHYLTPPPVSAPPEEDKQSQASQVTEAYLEAHVRSDDDSDGSFKAGTGREDAWGATNITTRGMRAHAAYHEAGESGGAVGDSGSELTDIDSD